MPKPKPYDIHELANKCSAVEIDIVDETGATWRYNYIDKETFVFGKEDASGRDKIKKHTLSNTKK